ncbi:MAG: ABC transporter permease [Bacillaceae bacterium]
MWTIMIYEWKGMFRQKFSYLLFSLYSLLMLGIILLQFNLALERNYTYTVTAISHLLLYIIPIISLLTSSFSILQEKETGQYRLLQTYPISHFQFINGKWLAQWLGNVLFITLSFHIITVIGTLFFHLSFNQYHFVTLFFIIGLSFFYSLIGTFIGCVSTNKWQGLIFSLLVWFISIILWSSIIIIVSRLLPFSLVPLFLRGSIFFNPAEYMRLLYLLQFNSGTIFGTSHATFVATLTGKMSIIFTSIYTIFIYGIFMVSSIFALRRDEKC